MAHSSSFVGFIELESTIYIPFGTTNSSEVPTNADSLPTCAIYSADMTSTLVASATVSNVTTGLYKITQTVGAGSGFASGQTYAAVVSYAVSASNRQQVLNFTVT